MFQIAPPDWLAQVQQPPRIVPRTATRPAPLLFDAEHRPITTAAAWKSQRGRLSETWRAFLGSIPRPDMAPVPQVIEEDVSEGVRRQLIRYQVEPGLPVEAYLLRPVEVGAPRAGMVVLHS